MLERANGARRLAHARGAGARARAGDRRGAPHHGDGRRDHARSSPAAGSALVVAPAFVDPHVHLRTPGREDEETLRSGTEAAAAGGYCAILAMPNTDPVVDSASVLGVARRARPRGSGRPDGLHGRDQQGPARGGAHARWRSSPPPGRRRSRTTAGRSPRRGLMRRALQYSALAGSPARAPLRGAERCPAAATSTRAPSRRARPRRATRRPQRASWSSGTWPSPAPRSAMSTSCTSRRGSRSRLSSGRSRTGSRRPAR